ncbi:deoxyhypusine synthase [Desulfurococcus mucosus DSM 2162]|uniref:Probable deoxyhypusine synthase n=2 Tax=Desulfurococcus mucosus TaxID=2275 RepID=E8R959_DESM0|nr:deoxyhypusine synthase [Desulfurococcus mucosus]ADV65035.1 deoxyhypusine synthase [Desulfurococcus mucosus DSM 2162]
MEQSFSLDEMRNSVLKEEVKDVRIAADMSICDLVEQLGNAHGFMAGHVYRASQILYEMIADSDATRLLAFTGNIVSTGIRGLLAEMIREGFFHGVITTCGAVDHDIARGTGHAYYKGDWLYDDTMLRALEIHRLGNILIPLENYGLAVEKFTRPLLEDLAKVKKKWSVSELLYEAGKRIRDENSILRAAYEKNIPVFVPGVFDGSFGSQIVFNQVSTGIEVDIISDEKKIIDMVFAAKKLGALIIGGGISKHHTIWWAQLRDGLDYAVYVTTAVEYDGSLSGAQPREAISWGKLKPSGRHVVVYADATIALPLIVGGMLCRARKGG